MEEAVEAALEEVAFEGRDGCSVSQLWELLSAHLPLGGYTQLVPSLKQHVWRALGARPDDVSIHAVLNATRQDDGKRVVVQLNKEAESFAKYPNFADAEADGVHLLASESVRFAVLGLFDAQESRFQLSEVQILTLELVGKTRSRGAVQSDLATELKIAHRNFFYVTKHLLCRGLIQKNPVMVPGSTNPSQHMTTNILHLRRFAPKVKLAPGQVFKVVPNHEGREGGSASYTIYDDAPWLKQVCDVLASTEERVVKEADLKLMLGFRMTRGHRNWRRIKQKLETAGYIECFTGAVNNKACSCVRLLKDFNPQALQGEDANVGNDAEEEEEEETVGGNTQVEVSLDRQMLDMVVQAGHAGITNVEVFNALKLNGKVYLHRMSDVVRRYGIITKVENIGKSILNRLYAPARLLSPEAAGPVVRPQVKRRSFLANGGALTLHQGVVPLPAVTAPAVQASEPLPQLPAPTAGGQAEPAGDASNTLALVGPPDSAADGASAEAKAQSPVEAMDEVMPEEAPNAKLSRRRRERDYRSFRARIPTSLSDDRMRRIEERLEAQGFVIRHEMRSYLHHYEAENGMLQGQPQSYKGPDRKTLERLVQRIENTGKARRVMVTLPPTISGGVRTAEAILRKDLPFNAEMEETIRSYTQQFDREIRQKCGRMKSAVTPDIPVVESVAQLRPRPQPKPENPDSPEAQVEMVENGFISAKMLRARLVHYLICKLVGLGGYQPVQLGPEASEVPGMRLPGYTQTLDLGFHHPVGVFQFANKQQGVVPPPPKAVRLEPVKLTLDDEKLQYAFTLKQLWEAMPMTLALQVVGTRKKVPGLLERCKMGEVIGELDEAKRSEIFDKHYYKRLIILLDVLKRMQLLDLVVKNSWDTVELTGVGTFYARTVGEVQVPLNLDKKPGAVPHVKKTRKRRKQHGDEEPEGNNATQADATRKKLDKSASKGAMEGGKAGAGEEEADAMGKHQDKNGKAPVPPMDVEKETLKYDLTKGEQLDAFWMKLELIFSHDRTAVDDPRLACFPCSTLPEILSKKVWQSLRLMSTVTWLHLQQRLEEEKTDLDWQKCQQIADELNVSYQQVLRASYEKRRRCRLEMLRSGQLVPGIIPDLRKEKKGMPRRTRNASGKPLTEEEKAERVREQAARYRQRQKERKRKLKEKQRALLSGSTRDRMLKSSANLFDELQVGEGEGGWADGTTDVDASGLPMRLETLQKRRFVAAQRSWTLEDDKKLLHTYVKWRVLHRNSLTWAKMPGWPAGPRVCQQRIFFMLRKQGALTRQLRVLCDQLRQHLLTVNKEREQAELKASEADGLASKRLRRGFASSADVKNLLAGEEVEVPIGEEPQSRAEDHQGLEDQWQQLQARPGDHRSEAERAAAAAKDQEDDLKSRQMLAEILSTADELMHTFPRNNRVGLAKPSMVDTTRAEVLQARARMAQRQREAEAAAETMALQDEWLDDVQDDKALEEMLEATGVISSARQLLQQWHARSSVGKSAAENEEDFATPPTDQVVDAMDFIRALLYSAHKQPPLPVEAANMLLQVLPAADVWNALQRLHKLGCFNRLGVHAYRLTRQFLLALTHTGFEEELFPLAYEASLQLSQQTSDQSATPAGFTPLDWTQCDGDEVGWCIKSDATIEGATVAEMLSHVSASQAKITLSSMKYQVGKKLQSRLELHQVAHTNDPVKLEPELKITWSTPYDQQRRRKGKKDKKGEKLGSKTSQRTPSRRIKSTAAASKQGQDALTAQAETGAQDGESGEAGDATHHTSDAVMGDEAAEADDSYLYLKPWLDHEGNIHTLYLESLVKKILAITINQPGIPLEDLLTRIQPCISTQNASILVQVMVDAGCLREDTRLVTPSFMPRLLRPRATDPGFTVKKFMFPTTSNTFSCWKIAEAEIMEALMAASLAEG